MKMDFEFYYSDQPLDGVIYDASKVLEMEDAAGIDRVVWMPQPFFRPDNRGMAKALEGFERRDRFILCCQVNPHFGQEAVDELEYCVTRLGMKSLKLMPTLHGYTIDSPLVYPLVEKCRELGVLVNIHSGSHGCSPLEIAALATRYPEVPIIMDHMGYRYHTREAITAAQHCPNIYLGTTIVSPAEPILVKVAMKEVGPGRIVFGSNGPGTYPDMSVEGIRRLRLGAEAEALILGETLARLYGVR